MHLQAINNNFNKPSFGTAYTVNGDKHKVNKVFEMAREHLFAQRDWELLLHSDSDTFTLLICADKASQELLREFKEITWRSFLEFLDYPLDIQLSKIFNKKGMHEKDVKRYEASEILDNPNFDFIEGIIK